MALAREAPGSHTEGRTHRGRDARPGRPRLLRGSSCSARPGDRTGRSRKMRRALCIAMLVAVALSRAARRYPPGARRSERCPASAGSPLAPARCQCARGDSVPRARDEGGRGAGRPQRDRPPGRSPARERRGGLRHRPDRVERRVRRERRQRRRRRRRTRSPGRARPAVHVLRHVPAPGRLRLRLQRGVGRRQRVGRGEGARALRAGPRRDHPVHLARARPRAPARDHAREHRHDAGCGPVARRRSIQWGGAEKVAPGKAKGFKGPSSGPYVGGVGRFYELRRHVDRGRAIEGVEAAARGRTPRSARPSAFGPGREGVITPARVLLVGERADTSSIVSGAHTRGRSARRPRARRPALGRRGVASSPVPPDARLALGKASGAEALTIHAAGTRPRARCRSAPEGHYELSYVEGGGRASSASVAPTMAPTATFAPRWP